MEDYAQMSVNQRISLILKEMYGGNVTQMARGTLIARTTLNSIIGPKEVLPGFDVIKRIGEASPRISLDWLMYGKGEMKAKDVYTETRPRIPQSVAAGAFNGFAKGVMEYECEQVPVVRSLPKYDFTMIVKGNSMEPKFEGGDEIAIKKVTDVIEWGKVYVLDTSDGAVLKRLYDDGDNYRCVSYNKEYPDFNVSKASVFGVYRVVGLIRI